MKFKVIIVVLFYIVVNANAATSTSLADSLKINNQIIDVDSLLESVTSNFVPGESAIEVSDIDSIKSNDGTKVLHSTKNKIVSNIKHLKKDTVIPFTIPEHIENVHVDSLLLLDNPFFIELVYMGLPFKFDLNIKPDFKTMYFGRKASALNENQIETLKMKNAEQIISELRNDARDEITRTSLGLYTKTFDELPNLNWYNINQIEDGKLTHVKFVDDDHVVNRNNQKLIVKKIKVGPWTHKSNVLAQFSENTVSSNWYQGGNNNIAVLGILSGQLSYDNKKWLQWDNTGEWRMGFNSVDGDTLRMLSTNDDAFKINSKLGIKAGGNFFYSGSVDFSTQFFHSYKGINSSVLKTSFLTPVRLNIGVGLDYKYKKILSLMVAPVSFKYIFMNDSTHVDPNLFGIKKGENHLSEIGSSFKAVVSYPITHEIQLNSNFSFYTNYQKVEIDWEVVCNMTINRFLSTRISFNPRYDNTVIMKDDEKARMQFKQLVSVGFSHRFN